MFSAFKTKKENDHIFISIASFCDDDLDNTIKNIIENAHHPEKLRFGICLQDTLENIKKFKRNDNIQVINVLAEESRGCCWARSEIQKLYRNEKYYLQLDAHCRLVQGWDTLCKQWLIDANSKKPILTSYLVAFDKRNSSDKLYLNEKKPYKLDVPLFYDNDKMRIEPSTIDDYNFYDKPIEAKFFSAHFVFTYSHWIKEVPYDENLYFEGEEDTLGIRSYTHGWDMFHPHRVIGYHFYTREGEIKHHDIVNSWGNMHEQSLQRMRIVMGMEKNSGEGIGKFGLGKRRSLKVYENFTGINFQNRTIKGSIRNERARKKLWSYLNGNFKKVEDSKWHEYKEDVMCHEFLEIEHDEHKLILFDEVRQLFVKIEDNKSYFKIKQKDIYNDWVLFNTGIWNGQQNSEYNNQQILEKLENQCKLYNIGKSKAIVSLRTPNTADWAKYAEASQLDYSLKHDFTYYLYTDLVVIQDIPHWNKVKIMMHLLPKYKYIVWIDSDAIFTNPNISFDDIISEQPQKSLYVCNDIGGWQLNTGVMILKNTLWMKSILKSLWEMDHIPHSKGAEQSSLIQLLGFNDANKENWCIFDQKKFNCHPRVHQENDFVLHMMGLSGEERYQTFDYWNKKNSVYESISSYNIF